VRRIPVAATPERIAHLSARGVNTTSERVPILDRWPARAAEQ